VRENWVLKEAVRLLWTTGYSAQKIKGKKKCAKGLDNSGNIEEGIYMYFNLKYRRVAVHDHLLLVTVDLTVDHSDENLQNHSDSRG
jgi:hypothetical protein